MVSDVLKLSVTISGHEGAMTESWIRLRVKPRPAWMSQKLYSWLLQQLLEMEHFKADPAVIRRDSPMTFTSHPRRLRGPGGDTETVRPDYTAAALRRAASHLLSLPEDTPYFLCAMNGNTVWLDIEARTAVEYTHICTIFGKPPAGNEVCFKDRGLDVTISVFPPLSEAMESPEQERLRKYPNPYDAFKRAKDPFMDPEEKHENPINDN